MLIKEMNESRFGVFKDWRLPSINELQSIAALQRIWPSINERYFWGTYIYWMSAFYWSSMSHACNINDSWVVNYYDREIDDRVKDSSYYIRAVRGGQCRSLDYLVICDDKTVTDTKTGLVWSIDTSESKLNWKNALYYCETYSLASYSDWRLPEREELRSIVDCTKFDPAIDKNIYNIMTAFYWSTTSVANYTDHAWGVDFYYCLDISYDKNSYFYVRAVRGH